MGAVGPAAAAPRWGASDGFVFLPPPDGPQDRIRMTRVAFIAVEGIDGSGKSTLIAALAERLRAAGHETLVLREPGSTPLGEKVREILLNGSHDLDVWSEICLFTAARAELVRARIRPALEAGTTVLLDRYLWSTLAYQCFGGGLGLEPARSLQLEAVRHTLPELVFWLDLPVEEAIRRRPGAADRIEARGADFLGRVRDGFATLAEQEAERFHRLDAVAAPETLTAAAWAALEARRILS